MNNYYRGTLLTGPFLALTLLAFGLPAVLSAGSSMHLALYQDSADAAEDDHAQGELIHDDPQREKELEDPRLGLTLSLIHI